MNTYEALKRLSVVVKNSRATLGLNQRDYAKLLETSHPSISNLENGKYINLPDHATLVRLARVLKIPYWNLMKILEGEEKLDSPEVLTTEEILVGVSQIGSLEDAVKILCALATRIDRF